MCQLGKNKAPSESLQKLVDDSVKWMYEHSSPLMMPQDACMPKPGEMLQTSLSMEIHLLGWELHSTPCMRIMLVVYILSKNDFLLRFIVLLCITYSAHML